MADSADVYVVSDLHLCEGWLPEEHRYARLEVFFYDREFSRWIDRILIDQLSRGRRAVLLLNGDVFDFLAITRTPNDEEARALGLKVTRNEKKFGLCSSAKKSAWKMNRIVRGHRTFFAALARFAASGNNLVFQRGNHDVELYWPEVQDSIRTSLARIADEDRLPVSGDSLLGRVSFRQWFYHEPGRLYIEHGNQFDEGNSFRFGLCPELPGRYTEDHEVGLDYPLGSLFVRYLYNKLKTVDPFTAYFVSVEQYVRLVGSYNFLDMARSLFLHVPIFFRAIKGLRIFEQSQTGTAARLHYARRARVGRKAELEVQVELLDRLVVSPAGKTKYAFLLELMRPVLRGLLTFLGVSLVAILAWFLLFQVIQQQTWLVEGTFGRASLLALLAVLTFIGLFLGFSQLNRRLRSTADPMPKALSKRAELIAEILDVPVVAMGHSHQADFRRVRDGKTVYANSGTWIRMPGPWDQIKATARQFTFLRIQGTDVEVLRWDDPNGAWEPVPLIEEYEPSPLERLLPEASPEAHEDK